MSIFQASILKTYKQDESLVAKRWSAYQNYLAKVEFIKTVKEEKYQDGFLHDIFEECLGYTLDNTNPQNFNLEREKKNETDGKKADGVLLLNNEVIGVIELKDQKTKNLDNVTDQAFNYHNSHSNSKYIIISNFDELRFYIEKKTAYEKFNLFYLTYDEFKKLHLLLSFESIKDGLPIRLKEDSTKFEQDISKELYKKFSLFRLNLFENLVKNNLHVEKFTLLRLTQKICDRIIFILFAEDRELLKKDTIKEIRLRHQNDGFDDRSLYDYYKLYFKAINEGNEKLGIPKYNGGLFAKDELLDNLKIDDNLLDNPAQILSNYNFESDISVNILGHIFEQSLTDLEEIQANIDNADFDKKQGKRKKDGVFYTPEYITRYIVDNTLGKLCEEKKKELFGSEVLTSPKNTKKLTKAEQAHKQNILTYREWLTNLKILDPACGSGAFLNQALEFLIKEHTLVRDMLLPFEDLTLGYEIEKEILEHNLYGVDINEDAVEIAKLSLWLRTAHKGRELTSLAEKIKCGNSLIDDKSVTKNAFVWEEEFAEVFAKGGFDVVIGNPPYGAKLNNNEWLKNRYKETSFGNIDSYKYFVHKTIEVVHKNSLVGLIIPDSYLEKEYFKDLRTLVVEHFNEITNIKMGDGVFEDVNLPTSIILLKNTSVINGKHFSFCDISIFKDKEIKLNSTKFIFGIPEYINTFVIKNNIIKDNNTIQLEEIYDQVMGVKVYQQGKGKPKQTEYEKNNDVFVSDQPFEICNYPFISQGIERYYYKKQNEFIKYGEWLAEPRKKIYFEQEKIIIREIVNPRIFATYIEESAVIKNISAVIISKNKNFSLKYLLALLNSKLLSFYIDEQSPKSSNKAYPSFSSKLIKNIPIKKINLEQQVPFIQKADQMLSLNKQLQETKQNFTNELGLEKLKKKLQNFEELEFEEFVSEYAKAKKLKFADKLAERNFKQEWQAIFENDKILTCRLKDEIAKTDKEIDEMVYKLYDLSDEEIGIVERGI